MMAVTANNLSLKRPIQSPPRDIERLRDGVVTLALLDKLAGISNRRRVVRGGRGVNRFGERAEDHASRFEIIQKADQVP